VVRLIATAGSNSAMLQCGTTREPAHLVALGMDIHRLRCALAAAGLVTSLVPAGTDDGEPADSEPDDAETETVAIAVGRAASWA
jgi:hypothetical protein